ncbi:helix-turn-helix domain-containing protein [Nitrospirota bacterium]
MNIHIDDKDKEEIAQRVAQLIAPALASKEPSKVDEIMDVTCLTNYLKIKPRWVYDRVAEYAIPYTKIGHYLRFRKSEIDEWLVKHSVKPIPKESD